MPRLLRVWWSAPSSIMKWTDCVEEEPEEGRGEEKHRRPRTSAKKGKPKSSDEE